MKCEVLNMTSIEIRSGSASGLICKFKIYIDGKYIQDIKNKNYPKE